MTYPYDNNWNVPESGSQNNGWTNPTQPQEPPMQTAWSGSSYHSVPPAAFTPPTPKKKRGGRTALKVVAAVMACMVI